MAHIQPGNPELLTDDDVDYDLFKCCGDEDLVFLRCPACAHIWVECYECSNWFVDLTDLSRQESSYRGPGETVNCPSCSARMADLYLTRDKVDIYLPTASQVIAAGYGRFLSPEQRKKHGSH